MTHLNVSLLATIAAMTIAAVTTAAAAPTPPASPASPASTATSLDLQIDPTPFFLGGFAPELGVSRGGHRVFATVVGYDVPRFLREDARFAERRDAIASVGYQYFPRGALDGPFVGGSAGVTRATFTLADGGSHGETTTTFRVAIRLGWLVSPIAALPGLFVAPWLSLGYSVAPRSFAIDGETIERKAIGLTGAAQLGWKF